MVMRPLVIQVKYGSDFPTIVGDVVVGVNMDGKTASIAGVDLEFDGLGSKSQRGKEKREHDSEGGIMLERGC
jgi:hypothetical protein